MSVVGGNSKSDQRIDARMTRPARDGRLPCEFCGTPLVDPIEEAFNLAFISHLRANARCMELFGYGMSNLRNEVGVRLGERPSVDGL